MDSGDSGILVAEGTVLHTAGFCAESLVTEAIASAPLTVIYRGCIGAVRKRGQDHTTIYRRLRTAQPLRPRSAPPAASA